MIRKLIVTSLLAAAFSSATLAQSDFHVTYVQRFDSGDPGSPVSMQVDIALERAETSSTATKWLPTSVSVQHFDLNGGLVGEWVDDAPIVTTPDGLWAVVHATETPKAGEFDESPPILGVGVSTGVDATPVAYRLQAARLLTGIVTAPDGGAARLRVEEDFGNNVPPPPPPPVGEDEEEVEISPFPHPYV